MKAKEQLDLILRLFERARRSGCTTAMMDGAINYECVVVTHDQETADAMDLEHSVAVSMQRAKELLYIKDDEMPVVLDNAAVIQILRLAIHEITKQENRVKRAKRIARQIASI